MSAHWQTSGIYGERTFLAPMATKPFLMEREEVAVAVPVLERLGQPTRYPASFAAVCDEARQAYRLIRSDCVARRESPATRPSPSPSTVAPRQDRRDARLEVGSRRLASP